MRFVLLIFFLLLLQLTSCTPKDKNIQEAITIYVRLLSEAYNKQNATLLDIIASKTQVEKTYHHMASFREGGVRMETDLIGLSFTDSKKSSDTHWEVMTSEEWKYKYIHMQSGSTVSMDTITYDLKYKVIRKDANWIIDSIEVLSASEDQKSNELIFLQRPKENSKIKKK